VAARATLLCILFVLRNKSVFNHLQQQTPLEWVGIKPTTTSTTSRNKVTRHGNLLQLFQLTLGTVV
jgi:hypothetical protein